MYRKNEYGQYQIEGAPAFKIVNDDSSQLQQVFTFQHGDVITIPDYSSEVTAKAANSLPTYQITCESENCLQFNIIPFEATVTPEFRFVIPNIKNETYVTAKKTIN